MVRRRSFVSISAATLLAAMVFSIAPRDLDAAPLPIPAGSETSVDWKGFLVGYKSEPGKQAQGLAICPFDDIAKEQARILIDSDFSLVDGHYNFQVFPTPDERSAKYWIKVVRTRQSEAEAEMPAPLPADFETKPVAELQVRGEHLYLLPTPLAATRIGAQLCNARIVVNQGGALQLVRLRETLKRQPVALSLVEDDTIIDFPTAPLPVVGNAFLDIKGVSGPELVFFPSDGDQRVPLESRTSYQTKGAISVIVDIDFRMNDEQCHCARIKPYYQIGKERRKAFIASEVMKAGASAERAIANAQRQLEAARSALPGIKSQLSSLGGSSGGDDRAQAERAAKIEYLTRLQRKAISTIRRFERSLPRSQASLVQLQQVRELGQKIHKKILVEFSVDVEHEGKRLQLAEYLAVQ